MACKTCRHPAKRHHQMKGPCLLPRCLCHHFVESNREVQDLCKFCLRESDNVMDQECFACWKKRITPNRLTEEQLQAAIADLNSKEIKPA